MGNIGKYILKKLVVVCFLMFGITILVYIMAEMCPGSPLTMLLQNPNISAADIEAAEARYGLDQPVIVQYFRWLGNCLKGNLGYSYRTGQPVAEMIGECIGATLMLSISSTVLALLIAIPLGALAAYKPYTIWDYASSAFSFLGAASPSFFVGLIAIYFLAVKIGLFPTGGMYDNSGARVWTDYLHHMFLPMIVLAFSQLGMYIRQTRSSMLDALNDDYVRTARSKGVGEKGVIFLHALRNSLIPVVTQVGLSLPTLIGGAVVIERVFTWPGLGTLMVNSIDGRDYPAIMGITVVISAVVLIGNMIVEILYSVLDPRIRK